MITITVPGGEAVLCDSAGELSPRRRRPIELVASRIGKQVEAASVAARLLCDGDVIQDNSATLLADGTPAFTGPDVDLSERDLELFMRLNDAMAWAVLKSWTLDLPLPACVADFMEIPIDVYDVIREKAAEINAKLTVEAEGFTVDAVEDPASPTGP
jgi:hypothetical protein